MRNDDVYIGTAKAAELLHITGRRVVGLCGEGKLPGAYRSGRNWKIPMESVKQFMRISGVTMPEESEADDLRLLPHHKRYQYLPAAVL